MKLRHSRLIVAITIIGGATGLVLRGEAIIDGTPVKREEYAQVFAIHSSHVFESRDESCTSVMVAPRLLITAGHCTHERLRVRSASNPHEWGRSQSHTGALYGDPIKWAAHPLYNRIETSESSNIRDLAHKAAYDIGYVLLKNPLALEPSVVGDYPDADSALTQLLGKNVTLVGYGGDEDLGRNPREFNDFGTKRTGTKPIRGIMDLALIFEGEKNAAVPGDSGGPVYAIQNGKTVVVGILSRFVRYDNGSYAYLAASLLRKETLCWVEKDSGIDIPSVSCE